MSKISLTPDPSGTGVFTISAPNSNTDRTLTLPDKAGTIHVGAGIDDNATSTAITIDSNGYITTPYQPSFFANRGTEYNAEKGTGWSKWSTFGGTEHNIGSHYSIANYRFTVPINGVYMFGAACRFNGVGAGYARLLIGVNGSTDYDDQAHSLMHANEGANYHTMCVTAIYQLSANDYVEVFSFSSDDTAWEQSAESTWWGRLIG